MFPVDLNHCHVNVKEFGLLSHVELPFLFFLVCDVGCLVRFWKFV